MSHIVHVDYRYRVEVAGVYPEYLYNVQRFHSVDGGKTFWYTGYGKFCKNLSEVFAYVAEHGDGRDDEFPEPTVVKLYEQHK